MWGGIAPRLVPVRYRARQMSAFLSTYTRSHSAGELRVTDVGQTVVLMGWVKTYRDHGQAIFVDLRDREGIAQLVFDPSFSQESHAAAGSLRSEWCVGIVGEVRSRGGKVNDKMVTGGVEVWVKTLEVFSKSETQTSAPPVAILSLTLPPRERTSPTIPTHHSERSAPAAAWDSWENDGSNTSWAMPSRSRRSTKMAWPWSR